MPANRREFLASAAAIATGATVARSQETGQPAKPDFTQILEAPVLNTDFLKDEVKIASIELLRNGKVFLLRTRSTSGAEAITVPHPSKMADLYPIFLKGVAPVFLNRDARDLEDLLWEAYRHHDNYKLQGLALWVCVAAMEISLLDLMGKAASRPVADFFGGAVRRDIAVYYASGTRGNTPEDEIEDLQKLVADSGVRAIKYRVGGRMSKNIDSAPGRSKALIPLVRRTFGDQITIYADSNSSYDVPHAIRIGKMMEENDYAFFEEPCEFDDLWSTKAVADALDMHVAGGEQEYSLHRFRWAIENRGLDIVQPDLHYGGGFIRATKVARMAAAAGLQVTPHMSGGGLGFLDVVHFASFTPNAGPFMEYKGGPGVPVTSDSSSLRCEKGVVKCPTGPGFGVDIDPEFVKEAKPVTLG